MKKLAGVMVIVSMMVLCSATVFAADAESEFAEAYEETEILTVELFEGISKALSGGVLKGDALLTTVDTLVANAKTLEKTAKEMGKNEAADEAKQMAAYLTRIQQVIQTGVEQHTLVMLLARYYLHYNNCMMVNTLALKKMQQDHVEELKEALAQNDLHEVEQLAEHLHMHSDQMYYAALIFGKKIWQKFARPAKLIADQIFEAAYNDDIAAVEAGVKAIENPVNMLGKLVKN